jgi:hypothetical protein
LNCAHWIIYIYIYIYCDPIMYVVMNMYHHIFEMFTEFWDPFHKMILCNVCNHEHVPSYQWILRSILITKWSFVMYVVMNMSIVSLKGVHWIITKWSFVMYVVMNIWNVFTKFWDPNYKMILCNLCSHEYVLIHFLKCFIEFCDLFNN